MIGRKLRGRIRNELVLGLVAVVLFSGLATYGIVSITSRRNFNTLVKKNDVEIARYVASSLADYYDDAGSWDGVENEIYRVLGGFNPLYAGREPQRPERRRGRASEIPLVLTNPRGDPIFIGMETEGDGTVQLPSRLKTDEGEKVVVGDTIVALVFYKSMIFHSYNPYEEAFVTLLTQSIGISVVIGLFLALLLGTLLASRFAKPVSALDRAVKTVADGNLGARVTVSRKDEIGSLADSFNRMAGGLQNAEAARQNLLADIAHELRTPVSIIQGNLEMILDGVYEADEERLKSLFDETRILTEIISDLRSLSDLNVAILPRHLEPVNIPALVTESCRKFQPLFDEKGIRLNIVKECDEVLVQAEDDRLRQVLRNILGNALTYAPRRSTVGISCEVIVRESDGAPFIRVTLSDEGSGVPAEDTDRIFERFYRVDPSRSRQSGGRGLGLAISKKIIEAFGGTIGAYNQEDSGLAVWFELPVDRQLQEL